MMTIKIPDKLKTGLELAWRYLPSLAGGAWNRKRFLDLESYCMFIGYPRSGHSLIGALLDAHPEMIVAHALGTLKYVHAGFSRGQICHLLLANSRARARKGRKQNEFTYAVPGQWQGRFTRLRVIGDKRASDTTLRLGVLPDLLPRLKGRLGLPVKMLHVVRNPYDNISTIAGRHRMSLEESIEFYFSLCGTVARIKEESQKGDIFEFRQESFIEDPRKILREICSFLDVGAPEGYLEDCAGIVFGSPHRSRFKTAWSEELKGEVAGRMERFPFLDDYTFSEGAAADPSAPRGSTG